MTPIYMKHILVTGGCGYVGSVLTEKLLQKGYTVTVVDAMWFGNFLKPHDRLKVIQEDIRNCENISLKGVDVVIHLANIANDPSVDLDPLLSWEVNVLATMQLADRAVRSGVKQFILASSGSVYGVSDAPRVTEDVPLKPLSAYNKTKMVEERVLLSYKKGLIVQIIRPGTVCGVSPRFRADLVVNMLTLQALTKGEITVLGGNQSRPAIHINDMADVYIYCLEQGGRLQGIYNASFENITVDEIAMLVTREIEAKVIRAPTNDPRSYRMCSDKLLAAGFTPRHTVLDAIHDIVFAHKEGRIKDDDCCCNVRWMKKIRVV